MFAIVNDTNYPVIVATHTDSQSQITTLCNGFFADWIDKKDGTIMNVDPVVLMPHHIIAEVEDLSFGPVQQPLDGLFGNIREAKKVREAIKVSEMNKQALINAEHEANRILSKDGSVDYNSLSVYAKMTWDAWKRGYTTRALVDLHIFNMDLH
jgi:hypothetical protein